MPRSVDPAHSRPEGVDDKTVAGVGKVSEALETIQRAKGSLYDFHQLVGKADFLLEDAANDLEAAGHDELAALLRSDIVGRNVLEGRWTFQIVEEFEDVYFSELVRAEERVRNQLMAGRRHVHEAEMKQERRSSGQRGHEARPDSVS